ncbi:hypothetical protein LSCM1_07286 [Leishmania martiniquensis]|uniref:Leucine-rich repeat-containing protein 51 n=1 Tax=Leishmania martiniquensis TaxID=1580590 RepID=A0A836HRC6_9TRYP|nr:hypothetical protein LSCM1_07286 [Leishmania martiniquensis]
MEYEQAEHGRRVVTEAIMSQDINAYYDLLAPQVLLVTHFPYPSTIADSNVQAVQRWVQLSEQQHIAVVDAATAAAADAAAAGTAATGGRGAMQMPSNKRSNGPAAAPLAMPGASRARSRKRRAHDLLKRQEEWRITQEKRYEAFRKRRELHHRLVADEGDEDSSAAGVGGADSNTTANTAHAIAAAAASGRDAADERGSPAALQQQRHQTGARKRCQADSFGKSSSAYGSASKDAANGSLSAAAIAVAQANHGVRWFHQQQQQQAQAQPPQQQTASGTRLPPDASAADAAAPTRPAPRGSLISYEDAVTITEGKLLVSYRLFQLLHWITSPGGKTAPPDHIAPIEVEIQLRKDILQEEEVLAPPPAPATVQEAYSQLGRQFTERNQPLSCMRFIWGADHLLFEDKMFLDDGLIVTIHRRMLTVPEVLARAAPTLSTSSRAKRDLPLAPLPPRQSEKGGGAVSLPAAKRGLKLARGQELSAARPEHVHRAVEAFYGLADTRIDACSNAWALLDFSFVKATEPSMLLRLTPVSGHVHANRLPRAVADAQLSQGVFLNQESDPSKSGASASNRTLIKARNKRGEEEAYEFQTEKHSFSFLEAGVGSGSGGSITDELGIGGGAGGQQRGTRHGNKASNSDTGLVRYDASCVRVSGCHLQAKMAQLVPVLRRLVANCLLTLHTLDLSQNDISTLPDLSLLPLQSLKLHGNAIADWRVVETQIAPLPYLAILTLHGNPIAEDMNIRAVTVQSGKAPAPSAHGAGGAENTARGGGRSDGNSHYWRRLLALLLRNPTRVAPLRQVDFVTLTGLDCHMAGAYEMFTTGQTSVLAKARSMVGSQA